MIRSNQRAMILTISWVLCLSFAISGCEPLRKKFVRQQKTEKKPVEQVILEPVDYPQKTYDAMSDYRHRFSLFHVWKKEFINCIDDDATPKRLRYLMDNMIEQLVVMHSLLDTEKSIELKGVLDEFHKIRAQLDMPPQFHDLSNMRRKTNSITQRFRSDYVPVNMEQYISADEL